MEDRKNEIQALLTSFVACLQPIIGYYRGVDGADVLKHFTIRVEAERSRYKNKFAALRADPGCAGLADLIFDIERQVDAIADGELARAKASNKVEYDHIASAIRSAANDLNSAVGKLESK